MACMALITCRGKRASMSTSVLMDISRFLIVCFSCFSSAPTKVESLSVFTVWYAKILRNGMKKKMGIFARKNRPQKADHKVEWATFLLPPSIRFFPEKQLNAWVYFTPEVPWRLLGSWLLIYGQSYGYNSLAKLLQNPFPSELRRPKGEAQNAPRPSSQISGVLVNSEIFRGRKKWEQSLNSFWCD